MSVTQLTQPQMKMFNHIINMLQQEIESGGNSAVEGMCTVLVDAVMEVYHYIKLNQEQNYQKVIKVRQALLRNERLTPFLLAIMTDQIQQILQIPNLLQLKEKVLKLILKMLKQLDFDLAS